MKRKILINSIILRIQQITWVPKLRNFSLTSKILKPRNHFIRVLTKIIFFVNWNPLFWSYRFSLCSHLLFYHLFSFPFQNSTNITLFLRRNTKQVAVKCHRWTTNVKYMLHEMYPYYSICKFINAADSAQWHSIIN